MDPVLTGGKPRYYLDSDLVLQEWVRIENTAKGRTNLIGEKWVDVEIFDDLESKEEAIEKLQKLGLNFPLKR